MAVKFNPFPGSNNTSPHHKAAINYVYAMYIRSRDLGEDIALADSLIRRLFVISLLTGRHSGSFETLFEHDIKLISDKGELEKFVQTLEEQTFTDVFWSSVLQIGRAHV